MLETIPLSNVSLGTADFLAYIMLILVAMFLVTAVSALVYYWRKMRRMQVTTSEEPTASA